MNIDVTDRLELWSLVVGALMLLGGLLTIFGQPWQQNTNLAVVGGELFGALMAIGIGALLVLIARDEELPF